ncbi:hypothetical protein AXE65_12735 [Ventosimonas gracilis]|uniref:Uncharacterized protein n=2 Tax=Ventosimonas gracilis TaxID=1680762 RepID=A0A139SVZ7_9GAMM|nr:hypothetical protein AXE65_12735 [Ventosimonas gracilis]
MFKAKALRESLATFAAKALYTGYNRYLDEQGIICASRNELENFLIDLLAEEIDKKIEIWITKEEPAKEEVKS